MTLPSRLSNRETKPNSKPSPWTLRQVNGNCFEVRFKSGKMFSATLDELYDLHETLGKELKKLEPRGR